MTKAKKVVYGAIIKIEIQIGEHGQCLQFGAKCDAALLLGKEQRLDPDRVAGKRQYPGVLVPDRRGVHAFQLDPDIVSPS